MPEPLLRRSLSLPVLTLYGLGTILGAGIYVLVGKVAGAAGTAAPTAFLVAAVLAALTGLSYAELSARFPESAGEAAYVDAGFGPRAAAAVALAVALTGVVSAATIAVGFVGYLAVFVDVPGGFAVIALVVCLGAFAAIGVEASAAAVGLMTIIELVGLLIVLWAAGGAAVDALPTRGHELLPQADIGAWAGVLTGAFVAFYAFIGFEDIVNMAEEVRDPTHALPRAILIALAGATVLYLAVAATCVLALPLDSLVASKAPLADVYAAASGGSPRLIAAISLVAVANGALVQIVMAARVLYGSARRGWSGAWLAAIHPRTQTPLAATAVVTGLVLALALWLPLGVLAQLTSLVILVVFALVNVSLWRLKRRGVVAPAGVRSVPAAVPALGAALILALLLIRGVTLLT